MAQKNPEALLCDSDALIQIFISRQTRILVHLVEAYDVQPTVVPEVETEVSRNGRFGKRFEPTLIGAMGRGHIAPFDEADVRRLLTAREWPGTALDEEINRLAERSTRYHRHVDRGEAYTHAAGAQLRLPAMSHDGRAIKVLEGIPEVMPAPVLRMWDLFALAYDDGIVTVADGEQAVGHLAGEHEYLPPMLAQSKNNFRAFIEQLNSRLRKAPVGTSPRAPQLHTDTLFLHPR